MPKVPAIGKSRDPDNFLGRRGVSVRSVPFARPARCGSNRTRRRQPEVSQTV
jgi:hypothetical protein